MSYGDAIIVDRLRAAELESTRSVVHDAEFGVRPLRKATTVSIHHGVVPQPHFVRRPGMAAWPGADLTEAGVVMPRRPGDGGGGS